MAFQFVSFNTAKRLRDADYPQPVERQKGQVWYNPHGEPTLIVEIDNSIHVPVWEKVNVHGKHRPEIFAPNSQEMKVFLPDWQVIQDGVLFYCFSEMLPATRYMGATALEALANTWIVQNGNKR